MPTLACCLARFQHISINSPFYSFCSFYSFHILLLYALSSSKFFQFSVPKFYARNVHRNVYNCKTCVPRACHKLVKLHFHFHFPIFPFSHFPFPLHLTVPFAPQDIFGTTTHWLHIGMDCGGVGQSRGEWWGAPQGAVSLDEASTRRRSLRALVECAKFLRSFCARLIFITFLWAL